MLFDKIKQMCKERGIKIADIEAATDVGKNVIYRWNESEPSLKNLKSVADFFDVTVDELLTSKTEGI